jgi:hypothetical protein
MNQPRLWEGSEPRAKDPTYMSYESIAGKDSDEVKDISMASNGKDGDKGEDFIGKGRAGKDGDEGEDIGKGSAGKDGDKGEDIISKDGDKGKDIGKGSDAMLGGSAS